MHLLRDALPAPERQARLITLVVGVGSPFGDDRVGWEVVAALQAQPWWREFAPGRVFAHACDRPGAALPGLLQGAARAIVVDAAQLPGAAPGTLHWLPPDQMSVLRVQSTHGFGVAEALALGRVLGQLPPRVHLLAIAAGHYSDAALSAPVRAAVPDAVRSIRALLLDASLDPASPVGDGT